MRPDFCNGEFTLFHLPAENTEVENQMNYATKYGSLTTHLDRGHLYIHHDIACQMTPAHAKILTNVFIKNQFRETTPRASQESKLTVLKLSEEQCYNMTHGLLYTRAYMMPTENRVGNFRATCDETNMVNVSISMSGTRRNEIIS